MGDVGKNYNGNEVLDCKWVGMRTGITPRKKTEWGQQQSFPHASSAEIASQQKPALLGARNAYVETLILQITHVFQSTVHIHWYAVEMLFGSCNLHNHNLPANVAL